MFFNHPETDVFFIFFTAVDAIIETKTHTRPRACTTCRALSIGGVGGGYTLVGKMRDVGGRGGSLQRRVPFVVYGAGKQSRWYRTSWAPTKYYHQIYLKETSKIDTPQISTTKIWYFVLSWSKKKKKNMFRERKKSGRKRKTTHFGCVVGAAAFAPAVAATRRATARSSRLFEEVRCRAPSANNKGGGDTVVRASFPKR